MPTTTQNVIQDQRDDIGLAKELLAIQSKLATTIRERRTLEQNISDLAVRQYATAQQSSGLTKSLLEAESKRQELNARIHLLQSAMAGTTGRRRVVMEAAITALQREQLQNGLVLVDINHQIEEIEKARARRTDALNKLQLSGVSKLLEKWDSFNEESTQMKGLIVAAGLIKNIYEVFNGLDKAAAEFRKSMGMLRSDSKQLETNAVAIAMEFRHLGVTAEVVYKSTKAIADTMGSAHYATKELTSQMSLMSAQLGITEKTSAEFLKTMGMVGRSTMESNVYMMHFTQRMATAAGIPLNVVMEDIASASKSSYHFLSKNPLTLTKAAVEAQRMGTNLEKSVGSASKLIEFTSSVKSEMEASVLLGKSLNLQKARELSYNRDIEGLNKEILALAKEANFEQLDPIQAQAVATALGKTTGEVEQMIQAEREWNQMLGKATNEQRAQLKLYDQLLDSTKERAKEEAKSVEYQIKSKSNAAYSEAISAAWAAILQRVASAFLPAIAKTLEGINGLLAWMNKSWLGIAGVIVTVGALVVGIFQTAIGLAGKLGEALGKAIGKGAHAALVGIGRGLMFLGVAAASPTTWLGIAAILALGAAFLAVAFGISLILKALPSAAEAFSTFTAALKTLELKDLGILYGLAGAMALMLPILLPFAVGAGAAGSRFMSLGTGLKMTISALKDLQSISLWELVKQTGSLSSALDDLAESISDIPLIDVVKLKVIGAVDVSKREGKGGEAGASGSTTEERMLQEIQALRKAMESGAIKVVLRVGAAELSSAMGREISRTGTYEPTGRVPV